MQSLRSGFEARYWLRAIAVNRALELDPDLAEAHAALGATRFYFESDWSGADAEFRRALAINPGSQAALEEYGNFLGAMGHFDAGFAQTREAARLDPLSVGPVHNLAIIALARGDLEEAEAGFRQAIDIDPHWTWGYIKLARALTLQGDPRKPWRRPRLVRGASLAESRRCLPQSTVPWANSAKRSAGTRGP
jgi:Tfp pilus assembly protein PilF